jgi:hypothetical protein
MWPVMFMLYYLCELLALWQLIMLSTQVSRPLKTPQHPITLHSTLFASGSVQSLRFGPAIFPAAQQHVRRHPLLGGLICCVPNMHAAFPPSAESAPACARLVAPSSIQRLLINAAPSLVIDLPSPSTTCRDVARACEHRDHIFSTSAAPPQHTVQVNSCGERNCETSAAKAIELGPLCHAILPSCSSPGCPESSS